jgi:hypothetical protein
MLRLVGGQAESLFDDLLPVEVRELPADLAMLDRLLADPRLLAPIEHAWEGSARGHGRPTIPMASFERLMVIKQRTGWGYCLCGSTPSMTRDMEVSLVLTGPGEPWPTVRRWDGTLMPLFSQATTGRRRVACPR